MSLKMLNWQDCTEDLQLYIKTCVKTVNTNVFVKINFSDSRQPFLNEYLGVYEFMWLKFLKKTYFE